MLYDSNGNKVTSNNLVIDGTSLEGRWNFTSCNDLNMTGGGGQAGDPTASGYTWIAYGYESCNQPFRLYGVSLPLPGSAPSPAGLYPFNPVIPWGTSGSSFDFTGFAASQVSNGSWVLPGP